MRMPPGAVTSGNGLAGGFSMTLPEAPLILAKTLSTGVVAA